MKHDASALRRTRRSRSLSVRTWVIDPTMFLTLTIALFILIPASLIIGPLGASGTPAGVLGLVGFLWWAAARAVSGEGAAGGPQPVRKALWFFAIAIMASYTAAHTSPLLPAEVRAADRGLINLVAWAGLALLAADGLVSIGRLTTLLHRLVIGGALMAGFGMLQFWFGFDVSSYIDVPGLTANAELGGVGSRSIFRRVAGTASHPIEYGVVLAQILPLAIHFGFGRRAPRRFDRLLLIMVAMGIPMAVSRSAVVGAATAWIVTLAGWNSRKRLRGIIATPFVIVGLRLAIPGLVGTLVALFRFAGNDPSIEGRTSDFSVVGQYVSDSPIFGRGFATFLPSVYTTFDNEYLLTLVQTGILGLTALITLLGTGYFAARRGRRQSVDPDVRDLGQAIAASILVSAVSFATFDALSFPIVTFITFLMLGSAGALVRLTRPKTSAPDAPLPKPIDPVLVVV